MPSYFKSTLYYNDKKSNRDRLFCRIACFRVFSKAQPLGNSLSTLVCGARSDWSRTASHVVIITPRRGVIAISTASLGTTLTVRKFRPLAVQKFELQNFSRSGTSNFCSRWLSLNAIDWSPVTRNDLVLGSIRRICFCFR